MTDENEHRIALFLDFENLVTNTGITAASFDLQPSLDRLLEKGKVIFRRAYCDWSRFKDAKSHLHDYGVQLIDVPPSTSAGKNGADMRLVIDALELCYAREYIDMFVIGSGDSDFCPLAYKLRENDRQVIGLGVKEATSRLFVKACDEFIYLKPQEKVERPPSRERERDRRPPRRSDAKPAERHGDNRPGAEVPDIAREVVTGLVARATGPINPSFIKETLVRKEPDFDERDYGFSSFSRLLEALEREGLIRRQQMGRQWYVLSPENAPENAGMDEHGDREHRDQRTNEPIEPIEQSPAQSESATPTAVAALLENVEPIAPHAPAEFVAPMRPIVPAPVEVVPSPAPVEIALPVAAAPMVLEPVAVEILPPAEGAEAAPEVEAGKRPARRRGGRGRGSSSAKPKAKAAPKTAKEKKGQEKLPF